MKTIGDMRDSNDAALGRCGIVIALVVFWTFLLGAFFGGRVVYPVAFAIMALPAYFFIIGMYKKFTR